MAAKRTVAIHGSFKRPLPQARVIAPASPDERLEVTVRLRPRHPLPARAAMLKFSSQPQEILNPDQFDKLYGADAKDIAKVRAFAKQNNLVVVRESSPRRSVMISGLVTDFNKAFGVTLKTYEYPGGTYRGRTGPVRIPSSLSKIVEGVFGLDNRPYAKRHGIVRPRTAHAAGGSAHPFTGDQLAKVYGFPPGDGAGQTIGIIELGGGYRPSDLTAYFTQLGLPTPKVIPVSVDGAPNKPSDPNSDDPEVGLDIQVAGAVAPGATYVVYFAPNDTTSKGFLDAITKAVHDKTHKPSIISISWGGPEVSEKEGGFQTQFDQVLQDAAKKGITVLVAAGDDGAADVGPRAWDGFAHVDFPSSSPFSLSCGGTRLIATTTSVKKETIWNQHAVDLSPQAGPDGSFGAGGGGVSGIFPVPGYQQQAAVPGSLNPKGFKGRGVPDVTGSGDPDSGYNILVDNSPLQYGGTSAVAPLWAGLIARINQKLKGRVGFINPQIYALPTSAGAFHDVTTLNNKVTYKNMKNVGYTAGPGWDACSGLGSPKGAALASVLKISKLTPSAKSKTSKSK